MPAASTGLPCELPAPLRALHDVCPEAPRPPSQKTAYHVIKPPDLSAHLQAAGLLQPHVRSPLTPRRAAAPPSRRALSSVPAARPAWSRQHAHGG